MKPCCLPLATVVVEGCAQVEPPGVWGQTGVSHLGAEVPADPEMGRQAL